MIRQVKFPGRPKFDALTAEELLARGVKGPLFTVLEDFPVEVQWIGTVVVPADFETDWASIPPWARVWMNDDSPAILAPSLVHDYGYAVRGLIVPGRPSYPRSSIDAILRDGMLCCGASSARAAAVHLAVQLGGASHWPATS